MTLSENYMPLGEQVAIFRKDCKRKDKLIKLLIDKLTTCSGKALVNTHQSLVDIAQNEIQESITNK